VPAPEHDEPQRGVTKSHSFNLFRLHEWARARRCCSREGDSHEMAIGVTMHFILRSINADDPLRCARAKRAVDRARERYGIKRAEARVTPRPRRAKRQVTTC